MADNLMLGRDAQVNHTIAMLRGTESSGALAEVSVLAPDRLAFLSWDSAGRATGTFKTGAGKVLELAYEVLKTPRWVSLHLQLGAIDFGDAAVFGIVCKSRAAQAATIRPCLRSASTTGFEDAFFDKHVVSFSEASTHVDLLRLAGRSDVPTKAPWRELILFFQTSSASFEIQDLRVFVV